MNILNYSFLIIISQFFSLNLHASSPVVLKWGISHDLYYHQKIAREFKEFIEKKTNERIKIEIDITSSNGRPATSKELITSNKYQITQEIIGGFSSLASEVMLWEIPFLFKDFEHGEKYILSAKAESVLDKINKSQNDFVTIGYSYSGGPLLIYSPFKINSFSDLKNSEMAVSDDFVFSSKFLNSIGIKGQSEKNKKTLQVGEELEANVDRMFTELNDPMNTWVNIIQHRIVTRLVVVSKSSLNQMKNEDRELFLSSLKKLMVKERQLSKNGIDLAMQLLKNRGVYLNIWTQKQRQNEKASFNQITIQMPSETQSEVKFINTL